ncbi:ABC transporter ATP-binding protein [Trichothermofontia sp.]
MASFRDILNYYRPHWGIALLSIGITSLFEIIDLLVPYAIGQILNVLSQQPLDRPVQHLVHSVANLSGQSISPTLALLTLLALIFVVTVVRAPIQPWLTLWFHWDIPLRARRDHNQRVLRKILTLPLGFYDENNPGRIAGRVARGIMNHTWGYPEVAGQMIPKLCRVLGIFVIVAVLEWRIALFGLISFITTLAISLRGLRALIHIEARLDRYMENTESRTSEIITNIKTVKAFATEAKELERQRQRVEREFKVVDYRIHKGYVTLATWQRILVQTSLFIVLALTLWATVRGQMSIGHFITVLTVSSMAYAELDPINNLAEVFARRYSPMLRFHELMHQPTGVDAATWVDQTTASPPSYRFTGKVEFAHVSFAYHADRPVLQDINFRIEPYQTVALVGRSGSGKSTLVKLLFRYYDPTSGAIRIDGQDIRRLDVTGYRKRLAIVHQEVDVFNGTLLDNLTYGNPHVSFDQVEAACAIARVDEFITQLPQGYQTIVGERGLRLSGGQRQRLGIARALLVDPDILVFDEATSSLDYESERQIQLAMRSLYGTRTLIIIAHRLSTVRDADQIVVLEQGRVAEIGSHEQLLTQPGIYSRLHTLQATGELLA